MHRFFTNPENITDEKIILRGSDVAHIRTVLRLKRGDRVEVLDGRGNCYIVILTRVGRDQVESSIYLKEDANDCESPFKICLGQGMVKGIPHFENSLYCPVATLQRWLNISKIKKGPLFRRFLKGSVLSDKRLTDQSIALIIKSYLVKAGIDCNNYSGHSLRSGFATSTAESGAEERNIMAMTGHKSTEMVRRYIKEANLFKNNALNKIKF